MGTYHSLPFSYDASSSFFEKLNEWIGDVFYDYLPEQGFELRDEQIFMAFQLERAFQEKKIMFAEAGVGTGKTIAYLLYSVCYARYMRKPVIISCADESLIEQLVKREGDIAKLSKALNLNIDARLAKSPDQYLCLKKLDHVRDGKIDYDEIYDEIFETLPSFVNSNETMQSFYHYGDRKDYSNLSDTEWHSIGWDKFQDCFVCDKRHRCGQTLSRDHYRNAADLIICSHDFYMEHLWTYDARKREGQLPLLPEASAVVFDEGHLAEVAAQKALTYKMSHKVLEEILLRLSANDVREQVALLIDEIILQSDHFFHTLQEHTEKVAGSDRREITFSNVLLREGENLQKLLSQLEDELVFESELYTIEEYQLRIVEEHIEMIQHALRLFLKQENLIAWTVQETEGLILVIMPRLVQEVLKEKLFSKRIPIIFSSATLSNDKSFDYMANGLGIQSYLSFSIDSAYDYEKQMKVLAPNLAKGTFKEKVQLAIQALERSEGRALILFNQKEDLKRFKEMIKGHECFQKWPFLFEGDQEISKLISVFQREELSVLCAVSLWEGLDIPGPSLSNVIVWSLPYPPNDPVFAAKRKFSKNAYYDVDVPYMLLRLRQGMGRLIRSEQDYGSILLLAENLYHDTELFDAIKSIMPKNLKILQNELNSF
ncbi:ATP-dependent DNA helicase [Bacillus taeanensis]|uniref:ATP-dependent DNA helicase n=1 Tax=Bacillus taeanensis TaxID=273032 RepID=A0A366XSV0_9BACI|nr:ATP-dependent DNA helicase [Bacillus taeanensis]RBW69212.1 ATP-dependent DNA helicase [Bacillus taeanensis]